MDSDSDIEILHAVIKNPDSTMGRNLKRKNINSTANETFKIEFKKRKNISDGKRKIEEKSKSNNLENSSTSENHIASNSNFSESKTTMVYSTGINKKAELSDGNNTDCEKPFTYELEVPKRIKKMIKYACEQIRNNSINEDSNIFTDSREHSFTCLTNENTNAKKLQTVKDNKEMDVKNVEGISKNIANIKDTSLPINNNKVVSTDNDMKMCEEKYNKKLEEDSDEDKQIDDIIRSIVIPDNLVKEPSVSLNCEEINTGCSNTKANYADPISAATERTLDTGKCNKKFFVDSNEDKQGGNIMIPNDRANEAEVLDCGFDDSESLTPGGGDDINSSQFPYASTPTKNKITYSKSIQKSPNKFFGSPQNKRNGKRFPCVSPKNRIDQYLEMSPMKSQMTAAENTRPHKLNTEISANVSTKYAKAHRKLTSIENYESRTDELYSECSVGDAERFTLINHVNGTNHIEKDPQNNKLDSKGEMNSNVNTRERSLLETNKNTTPVNKNKEQNSLPGTSKNGKSEIKKIPISQYEHKSPSSKHTSSVLPYSRNESEKELKSRVSKKTENNGFSTYRDFIDMCQDVSSNFLYDGRNVLTNADSGVLIKFDSFEMETKLLYSKLFYRKPSWIRQSKLKYNFINNIGTRLKELSEYKYVTLDNNKEDLKVLLNLLDKAELTRLCQNYGQTQVGTKQKLINSLIDTNNKASSMLRYIVPECQQSMNLSQIDLSQQLRTSVSDILGVCVKLSPEAKKTFVKVVRLYSFSYNCGRKEEIWEEVTKRKFGGRFPRYTVKHFAIFNSSSHYEKYEESLEFISHVNSLVAKKKHEEVSHKMFEAKERLAVIFKNEVDMMFLKRSPDFTRKFTPGNMYSRCIFNHIDVLKKKKYFQEAYELLKFLLHQDIYLIEKRGHLYESLLKIMCNNLNNYIEACHYLLNCIDENNVNNVSKLGMRSPITKILKNNNHLSEDIRLKISEFKVQRLPLDSITIHGRSFSSKRKGTKVIYLNESNMEYSSVEELALSYFKENGYPMGHHDEGTFLFSIILSCFWDIIYGELDSEYADISVFVNLYQSEPLDWNLTSFYKRRENKIMGRLEEIRNKGIEKVVELVETCYNDNYKTRCVFKWDIMIEEELRGIKKFIHCLPLKFILSVAKHLLKDFKTFQAGFPDLTLWNPIRNECLFVEVKGRNDQLSDKQYIWLENITQFGSRSQICYVLDNSNDMLPDSLD